MRANELVPLPRSQTAENFERPAENGERCLHAFRMKARRAIGVARLAATSARRAGGYCATVSVVISSA
jgi:hypothetical protein